MKNPPQIFRQNKWKNLLLFLISSLFVAIGYFIVEDSFMKWFGICFFGLGGVASIVHFFPNSSYLKLTEEGFEVKNLYRTSFTKWSDIKGFRQGHKRGNKMIFFDFTDEHKKWKHGKKLAKFLSGNEGEIMSSYTIKTEELLKLMKEYKRKSE